jgi:glycosyltransferase involved in cell wall biosynthesis
LKTEETISISIAPDRNSNFNSFIGQFAQSIEASGAQVHDFRWRLMRLARSDAVILHWPDEFFQVRGFVGFCKTLIKLLIMRLFSLLFNTRFLWVAHNAKPHEAQAPSRLLTQLFCRSLSGIIYLSSYSREVVTRLYPSTVAVPALMTVHGHYLNSMRTTPSPPRKVESEVRLAYFGQIRPYKNVLELVRVAGSFHECGLSLTVMGMRQDKALSAEIESAAKHKSHINLDLRSGLIPDTELEAAIDWSDAVVLPYRDILNSGSAIFALSRSRPVLAPRLGSLIELQAQVGFEWIYLYDGNLTVNVLEDFLAWIRNRPSGGAPDLAAYAWPPIGNQICRFVRDLR